ncbi:hypothetical protein K0M31_012265 [Melipona bicolor]|uniref:Uncharacterized protein n=1 Tax=Melipona bicolor TaxID=60889 RepID=A0AA40FKT0_9HYME|nr:hypothetical protein K0M31_012265 [Melipona bicolor]
MDKQKAYSLIVFPIHIWRTDHFPQFQYNDDSSIDNNHSFKLVNICKVNVNQLWRRKLAFAKLLDFGDYGYRD